MGEWSREELEREFEAFQERARVAAGSGDWRVWSDQFTEDASYLEHHFGEFEGREAIHEWIQSTMDEWPNCEMTSFPVQWHVIDTERGWVICEIQNRLADPGDGSVFEAPNITILHYAGNGEWSYEEDVYNPVRIAEMVAAYLKHKRKPALA